MKKKEIQAILFMIILGRSSDRIFNPMRYTGDINSLALHYIVAAIYASGRDIQDVISIMVVVISILDVISIRFHYISAPIYASSLYLFF